MDNGKEKHSHKSRKNHKHTSRRSDIPRQHSSHTPNHKSSRNKHNHNGTANNTPQQLQAQQQQQQQRHTTPKIAIPDQSQQQNNLPPVPPQLSPTGSFSQSSSFQTGPNNPTSAKSARNHRKNSHKQSKHGNNGSNNSSNVQTPQPNGNGGNITPYLQANSSNAASDPGYDNESDTDAYHARAQQHFFNKQSFSAHSMTAGSPLTRNGTSQFLSPVLHNSRTNVTDTNIINNNNNNNNGSNGKQHHAIHRRPRAHSDHKMTAMVNGLNGSQTGTPHGNNPIAIDKLPPFGAMTFSNSSMSAVSVASSVSLSARLSSPDLISLFSKLAPTVPGTRFQHLLVKLSVLFCFVSFFTGLLAIGCVCFGSAFTFKEMM